jgi:hypothetical protein
MMTALTKSAAAAILRRVQVSSSAVRPHKYWCIGKRIHDSQKAQAYRQDISNEALQCASSSKYRRCFLAMLNLD